jgi:hypothetical protein
MTWPTELSASAMKCCPPTALEIALNAVMNATGDIWIYYCFNAEFLFYPFNIEERRNSVMSYVVDLYTEDLWNTNAVCIEDAHLDKTGYYALARTDRSNNYPERQLDFFGGLRWRFEEYIPSQRRRIDRVSIFHNKPGLVFKPITPSMIRNTTPTPAHGTII